MAHFDEYCSIWLVDATSVFKLAQTLLVAAIQIKVNKVGTEKTSVFSQVFPNQACYQHEIQWWLYE